MQIQFFFPLNKFLSKSFLFFVFFFTFITNAQEPFIRKISFLEGLPSDVIYDMYVSKNGLLYLGTDKGLVSYDGIHFTLFPFDENLSNSVNSIQEDEKGIIYCKNFSNQIYYLSDDRLNLDTNFDDLITKKKLSVVEFSVLGKQKVLLTPNQFFGIEKNKSFLIYQSEGLLDKNDFFHLAFNPFKNEFYISSIATILSFKNKKLQHKIKVKNGGNILEFHQGQLCYSAKSIESKVSVGESFIDISNLKQTVINKISSCENDLWICSNDGVFEINLDLKKAENDFLKGKRISDIVKDKEGNHWISTLDNGLFFMPNKNLKNLSIKQIDEQKKPNFSRVKIAKNGHFFVATSTGCVYEFNEKGVQILRYQSENNLEIEFITLHNDLILTSAAIFKVGNPKPISHKSMYFGKDIVVDNYGNFIIASSTYAGLLASDLNTKLVIPKNFGKFQLRKFGTNASFLCFRERRSRAVFYDKSSNIYYISYNDDLYYYDNYGNAKIIKLPNNESIIASEFIQTNDGSLWIATTQKGIIQIKNQKVVKHLTVKNKLSSNNCRRIEIDNNMLWILNDKGIETYNFATEEMKNISANLCMKGITINDFVVNNNTITFITNEGVFFTKKEIVNDIQLPKFSFTNLSVNNKKISFKTNLVLDYDDNNIQINFRTIFYKSLGDYKYEYRIKNSSNSWNTLSSQSTNIKFESLKYGKYHFQIRVKYGDHTTKIEELFFEVKKPFWLQWWFITLEILTLAFALFLVNKRAVLRTKKKQEIKEQLALSQITALRSQMNPHFMFNILNSVQGLIYSNQKSKASEYLGKFSDLMRKILETSDKKEITVEKEFEMLEMYVSLENTRFDNDFNYSFSLPNELDLSQYKIPSMIIQPFIENAIKHGLMHKNGSKELIINAKIIDNYWHFTIEDNGIGRIKSEQINKNLKSHTSFATEAISNRIELINKMTASKIEIKIEDKLSNSNESLGTKISILIPVKII